MFRFHSAIALTLITAIFTTSALPLARASLDDIDASGAKGADGNDGRDYGGTTASGAGSDGANAGDATHARTGQDAGGIDLELSTSGPGVVVLKGAIIDPKGNSGGIKKSLQFGKSGSIYLRARGGDGGHGGDGGNGQNGAKGYNGRDATETSDGTDGGDGGDGGNGGDGTSGANAGAGGRITVKLDHKDTHLIMLVRKDVAGGAGGKAGSNGSGGAGGPGGDGGSSHSWTTTNYVTKTRTVTDAEGNTSTETYTDTETEWHHRSGGSDGSPGRSGSSGNAALHNGTNGNDGKYTIRVVESDGSISEYTRPYDLKLLSFDIESDNKDGIIEPGERIHVSNVRVRNIGGMPTPAFHKALIFIESKGWVVSEGMELTVPKSLSPGEDILIKDQPLSFKVKDTTISTPGDRFRVTETISPVSMMDDVHRYFEGFENHRNFEITFPLEITPITALESMGAGHKSRIYLKVTNISQKTFGGISDLKREIAIKLRTEGGELPPEAIEFRDSNGKPLGAGKGLVEAISKLAPGESMMIEGVVAVDQNAPHYTDSKIMANLELGEIGNPSKLRTIQKEIHTIRIAQMYAKTPDSSVLLIANHGTERREIEQWKHMLTRMGLGVDVWDLSFNGFLALSRELAQGGSLMQDFQGKTIILLNNEFSAVAENRKDAAKARANYFVAKQEFFQATAANGTHFYIVGGDAKEQHELLNYYLLSVDGARTGEFSSVKDFFKSMRARKLDKRSAEQLDYSVALNEKSANDFLAPTDVIEINAHKLWGEPKPEHLTKVAKKLNTKLEQMHPDRRYVVVHKFNPEKTGNKKLGWSEWKLGELEVRQTLDASIGSAVAIAVDEKTVHTPQFVTSLENHLGLFMAMTFEQKIDLFDKIIKHDLDILDEKVFGLEPINKPVMAPATAEALIDAILITIADEQNALRRHRWKSGLTKEDVSEKLVTLKKLATHGFPPVLDADDPNVRHDPGELMVKLASGIRFLLESQNRWYDLGMIGRKDPMVTKESMKLYEQFLSASFGSVHGPNARELIKLRVKQLHQETKLVSSQLGLDKKDAAMTMILEPSTRKNMTIDTQAATSEERVVSQERVKSLHGVDMSHATYQQAMEQRKQSALTELLVRERAPDAPAAVGVRVKQELSAKEECEAMLVEQEALEQAAVKKGQQ